MFWSKYARDTLNKIKVKLKSDEKSQSVENTFSIMSHLFGLPLSVVTSVECSDWSVQLHSDVPSLQAKEPLCRVVMATCAGNVQWDPVEDKSTTLKYVRSSIVCIADLYLGLSLVHNMMLEPAALGVYST